MFLYWSEVSLETQNSETSGFQVHVNLQLSKNEVKIHLQISIAL